MGGLLLSAVVLARTAKHGLPRLLAELTQVADEVVVGLDETATDETCEAAIRGADVVYRFEHTGPPVRARLLALEHASGEWILSLDEDEGLDQALDLLLPQLTADSRYSHYIFPRKWMVSRDPDEYLRAAPWFPDWQLRLFRNDRRRVWHPGVMHSGYRVMGTACYEDRGAVLHYEPLLLDDREREAKIELYRAHGSNGRCEELYRRASAGRIPLESPPWTPVRTRTRHGAARLVPGVCQVPPRPSLPPWGAELEAWMPRSCPQGAQVQFEIAARNIGRLAWVTAGPGWPQLHLSYHLRDANGGMIQWDNTRIGMPREVDPGQSTRFLGAIPAPSEPGDYILEWDLVSEGECWFAECGSVTANVPLHVT